MDLSYLKKYIHKYKNQYLIAVIFVVLETLVEILNPTLMSMIVDDGVKNRNLDYVLRLGIFMLLITGLGAVFAVIRNVYSSRVSQSFAADLREDLYIKVLEFSFDNVDRFQGASLITRLTNDVNQLQNFSHSMMRVLIKSPVRLMGSIVMSFLLDYKMGFILLATVPIALIIIFINLRTSYPLFKKMQVSLDKVNTVMREYLAGIRVVKAFNRFNYEKQRFREANSNLKNSTLKGMRIVATFNPTIGLIINMGIVIILWVGGIRVDNGSLEVGKVMAFINYMLIVHFALRTVSRVLNRYIRARASAERIGKVFAEENTILETLKPVRVDKFKGNIEFNHVYFKYSLNRKCILKDINFSINAGETLAIIGPTGSGKTTLINLIPRFYDVSEGEIKIDSIDVRDISTSKLRQSIAIVPQRPLLFTGTIMDNIKWGNESATLDDVVRSCMIAQCHDFITSFTDGYDTYLGQGGVNLSGGQKQRISIARALIRNPAILILDDSTSAVDMITEKKIKEGLKEYLRNTTTILIAQRITSVMDADKIIVMDNGKIVGIGNHNELMKNSRVYKDIYRSQIGKGVGVIGS